MKLQLRDVATSAYSQQWLIRTDSGWTHWLSEYWQLGNDTQPWSGHFVQAAFISIVRFMNRCLNAGRKLLQSGPS